MSIEALPETGLFSERTQKNLKNGMNLEKIYHLTPTLAKLYVNKRS